MCSCLFFYGYTCKYKTRHKKYRGYTSWQLVWAYDEDTNNLDLQPVLDIMQNRSDYTISFYTENEVIETTTIHAFYTEQGWKDTSQRLK